MPILYRSIHEEHHQVRTSGGVFDVSHMGRIKISGRHARRFLERLLTRRISDMKENTCRYSLICNEQGGTIDDVIVYRLTDHWLLVVNASNREKVLAHMKAQTGQFILKIDDQTMSTAMVAAQGPRVMEVIGQFSREVPSLRRYSLCTKNLLVVKMIISRTGYTGEDGVEVILSSHMADMAVKLLLKDRADQADILLPAGLGARDTLRLEAGMCLYGHELDEQTDPFSADLDFAVSIDKDEDQRGEPFIGQAALKTIAADGLRRRLIGLKLDGKRTARQGMDVYRADKLVGTITSGCLSPTLGYPIAMAYVETDSSGEGESLQVELGTKRIDAQIVPRPFFR